MNEQGKRCHFAMLTQFIAPFTNEPLGRIARHQDTFTSLQMRQALWELYRNMLELATGPPIDLDRMAPLWAPRSKTSKAAAKNLMPTVGTKRWKVLAFIGAAGGLGVIDWELHDHFTRVEAWPVNTAQPRRCELEKAGLVEKRLGRVFASATDSVGRVAEITRPTPSGNAAQVYVITQAGIDYLKDHQEGPE